MDNDARDLPNRPPTEPTVDDGSAAFTGEPLEGSGFESEEPEAEFEEEQ